MAWGSDEPIAILEPRRDIHIVFTDIQVTESMDGLKLARFVRDSEPRQSRCHFRSGDRELLLQTEGIQAHRNALRQNRSDLRGNDLSRRRDHQFQMNLNRP
jgi:hypothetical protein